MRCACIDIGSNTTRLLVAEPGPGGLTEVVQLRAFTRIGRSLDELGAIPEATIDAVAKVVAEQRAGSRGELESPPLDQCHDGERREALGATGGREQGVDGVGYSVGPVGEPVRRCDLGLAGAVDADHTGEPGVLRRSVHRVLE